jgi:hypothetical protein
MEMANRKSLIGLTILALLLSASFISGVPPDGPGFRTVHQFSLSSAEEEGRLLAVLDEFNRLFSKLGYPQVSYRLWRVQEGEADRFTHLYDSTWPDKSTYDKVHQDPAYKKLLEKHLPFLRQVLKDEAYSKYLEI